MDPFCYCPFLIPFFLIFVFFKHSILSDKKQLLTFQTLHFLTYQALRFYFSNTSRSRNTEAVTTLRTTASHFHPNRTRHHLWFEISKILPVKPVFDMRAIVPAALVAILLNVLLPREEKQKQ